MADNYQIQLQNAQKFFLSYDQEHLIQKFGLHADEDYLYPIMFRTLYRIDRKTGNFERYRGTWQDANTFGEVMTLLDILCDSKDDRYLTGKWMSTQMFGKYFHSGLLEPEYDALADAFDKAPSSLWKACKALGGHPIVGGDEAYAVEIMDGLEIGNYLIPRLATVCQSLDTLAQESLALLLAKIEKNEGFRHVNVPVYLEWKESARKID